MCDLEGCIKRGQSACTGTNGNLYCTMTHLKEDGAKQSEEAKAKKVSSKVCSLLLLLVSLVIQLTLSPFVSNRSCRAPRTMPRTMPRGPWHFWRRSRRLTMRIMQEALALTANSRIMRSKGSRIVAISKPDWSHRTWRRHHSVVQLNLSGHTEFKLIYLVWYLSSA